MFRAAQNGATRGDPMYATCDQSKVTGNRPRPDTVPNFENYVSMTMKTLDRECNVRGWLQRHYEVRTR